MVDSNSHDSSSRRSPRNESTGLTEGGVEVAWAIKQPQHHQQHQESYSWVFWVAQPRNMTLFVGHGRGSHSRPANNPDRFLGAVDGDGARNRTVREWEPPIEPRGFGSVIVRGEWFEGFIRILIIKCNSPFEPVCAKRRAEVGRWGWAKFKFCWDPAR